MRPRPLPIARLARVVALAVGASLIASVALAQGAFTGLGLLPVVQGLGAESRAYAVSADGATVVGSSLSVSDTADRRCAGQQVAL